MWRKRKEVSVNCFVLCVVLSLGFLSAYFASYLSLRCAIISQLWVHFEISFAFQLGVNVANSIYWWWWEFRHICRCLYLKYLPLWAESYSQKHCILNFALGVIRRVSAWHCFKMGERHIQTFPVPCLQSSAGLTEVLEWHPWRSRGLLLSPWGRIWLETAQVPVLAPPAWLSFARAANSWDRFSFSLVVTYLLFHTDVISL